MLKTIDNPKLQASVLLELKDFGSQLEGEIRLAEIIDGFVVVIGNGLQEVFVVSGKHPIKLPSPEQKLH